MAASTNPFIFFVLLNREQDKVISPQIDAIKEDKTGVKSLTALRGLLNLISYGIDSEGDAVLYSL